MKIGNTSNVVVGNVCENFVLNDGNAFAAPKTFIAAKVNYTRPITNKWGTICLPYATQSDEKVQYYRLKEQSRNTLVFSPVDALSAGEPGVFQNLESGAAVGFAAENASIAIETEEVEQVMGLKLVGTYETRRVDVDENSPCYYIKDNMFKKGVGYFSIPAFRAYFQTQTTASAKVLYIAIENEATGIQTPVGKLDGESGDIHTLGGIKVSQPVRGNIYIQNNKKYFAK